MLSVRTPGGGGHGDPLARPPAEVLADVAAGLISPEHARAAYGVALTGHRVDEAATAALRMAARRAGAPSRPVPRTASPGEVPAGETTLFDFGPARREHERRWPPELQDQFVSLLMSLPAPYRAYVRRTLHARAAALAAPGSLTAEDLRRLWQDVRGSIGLG